MSDIAVTTGGLLPSASMLAEPGIEVFMDNGRPFERELLASAAWVEEEW